MPLYRVSAAAAGSLNAWERQAAAADSARLLQRGAPDWLEAYRAAGPARRLGLMDALDQAEPEQLSRLADSLLERLTAEPHFTPAAARAGVLLREPSILGQAVATGGGPGLGTTTRSVPWARRSRLSRKASRMSRRFLSLSSLCSSSESGRHPPVPKPS